MFLQMCIQKLNMVKIPQSQGTCYIIFNNKYEFTSKIIVCKNPQERFSNETERLCCRERKGSGFV